MNHSFNKQKLINIINLLISLFSPLLYEFVKKQLQKIKQIRHTQNTNKRYDKVYDAALTSLINEYNMVINDIITIDDKLNKYLVYVIALLTVLLTITSSPLSKKLSFQFDLSKLTPYLSYLFILLMILAFIYFSLIIYKLLEKIRARKTSRMPLCNNIIKEKDTITSTELKGYLVYYYDFVSKQIYQAVVDKNKNMEKIHTHIFIYSILCIASLLCLIIINFL